MWMWCLQEHSPSFELGLEIRKRVGTQTHRTTSGKGAPVRDVDVVAVGDVDVVPAYIRVNSHLIASEVSRTTHTCAGCGCDDDVGHASAPIWRPP